MTLLAFCDLETTGLDPHRHEIWDVGLIIEDEDGKGVEYQWFLPVTLETADPMALTVGKFYERHPHWQGPSHPLATKPVTYEPEMVARRIATLTNGAHLVGNVISFDANFLTPWMRAHGAVPTWHYHIVDCETLVAGALGLTPPWRSKDLSAAVGVKVPTDIHSALADARWARDLYHAALHVRDNDAKTPEPSEDPRATDPDVDYSPSQASAPTKA